MIGERGRIRRPGRRWRRPMTDVEQFLARPLTAPWVSPAGGRLLRLAEGIRSGVFSLGSALPQRPSSASRWEVSRTVVREALMLLEEAG
jgi:GntR family transcriptional regulator